MQTQVQRLREVLELLKPVVPTKTALPILTNVLLKEGYVTACDLESQVDVAFPEAQEALLLPYRDVMALLKTIPGSTRLDILSVREGKGTKVSLLAGAAMASFKMPLAEDYPPGPQRSKLQGEFRISGDLLIRDLEELSTYAAREDVRPVLRSVALFPGDEPELVASDGFRMGVRSLGGSLQLEGIQSVLIPLGAVLLLSHLWRKGRKTPEIPPDAGLTEVITGLRLITVGIAAERLFFGFGDIQVTTARVVGNFPNYRPLIPADPPLKVTVDTERLGRALKSVSRIAHESSNIVRLEWKENGLTISARAEDVGEARVEVPARVQGEGQIAFDINKFMEYLTGKEGMVTIATTTPSAPAVLTDGGATKVVLMPMLVTPEGSGKGKAPAETPTESTPQEPEVAVEQGEPSEEVQEAPPAAEAKPKRKRRSKA